MHLTLTFVALNLHEAYTMFAVGVLWTVINYRNVSQTVRNFFLHLRRIMPFALLAWRRLRVQRREEQLSKRFVDTA